jgi:hypothetical protein
MAERARGAEAEARERVQMVLGLLSLVIWFVVACAVVVALDLPRSGRPSQVLLVGLGALLVAALPWLGYRRLVAARRRPARSDPGRGDYGAPPPHIQPGENEARLPRGAPRSR